MNPKFYVGECALETRALREKHIKEACAVFRARYLPHRAETAQLMRKIELIDDGDAFVFCGLKFRHALTENVETDRQTAQGFYRSPRGLFICKPCDGFTLKVYIRFDWSDEYVRAHKEEPELIQEMEDEGLCFETAYGYVESVDFKQSIGI